MKKKKKKKKLKDEYSKLTLFKVWGNLFQKC
jgi:hypothetical protein